MFGCRQMHVAGSRALFRELRHLEIMGGEQCQCTYFAGQMLGTGVGNG